MHDQPRRTPRTWVLTVVLVLGTAPGLLGAVGCAHTAAIGGGGPVFAVSVESIDGYRVVMAGHMSGYSYLVQVGDVAARVWPVMRSPGAVEGDGPPLPEPGETLIEADAEALKSGILIERSWNQAVVHEVTDEELDVGAAVVFVPGERRSVIAELRFRRLGARDGKLSGAGPSSPCAVGGRCRRTALRTGRTPPP